MTDEKLGKHVREANWDQLMSIFRDALMLALARHPVVGPALSYSDGEKLTTSLSAELTCTAHRFADPEYDA